MVRKRKKAANKKKNGKKDVKKLTVQQTIAYKTFMPRILGTTINETYMGHDWVFSCLP